MNDNHSKKEKIHQCDFLHLEALIDAHSEGLLEGIPRTEDLRIIGIHYSDDDVLDLFKNLSSHEQEKLIRNIQALDDYLSKRFKPTSSVYKYFESWMTAILVEPYKIENESKIVKSIESSARINATQYLNTYLKDELPQTSKLTALLKRVLVSACAFGGLVSRKLLERLYEVLVDEKFIVKSINDEMFIDLVYKQFGHATNIKVEGPNSSELLSLRRWFIDPLSQMSILEFMHEKAKQRDTILPPVSKIISLIYKDLDISQRNIAVPRLLILMFESALKLTNLKLPIFLKTYATTEVFAGSTPYESLKTFCQQPREKREKNLKTGRKNNDKCNRFFIKNDNYELHPSTNDRQLLASLAAHCKRETSFIEQMGGCEVVNDSIKTQRRQKLISECDTVLTADQKISLPAVILVEWIFDGIQAKTPMKQFSNAISKVKQYRWEIGKNTPYRYLSLIYDEWLKVWQTLDITEQGESEIQEIHDDLIRRLTPRDKLAKDIVPLLFSFIAEYYSETIALPETLAGRGKNSHVRSQLISEAVFQKSRQVMLDTISDTEMVYKQSVDLILIFAYRCAMRPSEIYALRVDDVSLDGENCIIRMGKTDSAKRSVPIYLLLLPSELALFKAHVYARKRQVKSQDSLLFTQSASTNTAFDHVSINRKFSDIFSQFSELRTVFYQTRHTAISLIELVCFCDLKTAGDFSGYDDEQILKIKRYFSADPRKTLYQISRMVGHISPNTTLPCYSHFMDLCLKSHLNKIEAKVSVKRCASLLKKTQRDFKKIIASDANGLVNLQSMTSPLRAKFKKYVSDPLCTSEPTQALPFKHMLEHEPSLSDLQETLRLANAGETDDHIASCLAINKVWVRYIKHYAGSMFIDPDYRTRRGKSTIVRGANGDFPVPEVIPHSELGDAEHIFDSVKRSKERLNAVSGFLKVSLDHSYLTLESVPAVARLINANHQHLEASRWFVTVDWPNKFKSETTKQLLLEFLPPTNIRMRGGCVSIKHYPRGRFELMLLRARTKNRQEDKVKKYGTNSLRVAAFYATVFSLTKAMVSAKNNNSIQRTFNFD